MQDSADLKKEAEIVKGFLMEVGYGDAKVHIDQCFCGFCDDDIVTITGNVPEKIAMKALFLAAESFGKPHPCPECYGKTNKESFECENGNCSSGGN